MVSSLYQHLQESGTGESHMPLDSHADVDIGGRETAGATSPKKWMLYLLLMYMYVN